MAANLNLHNEAESILFGQDCILVMNPEQVEVLVGGRVLDMTDFKENVIKAGHVIITDGNGTYKPMPTAVGEEEGAEEAYTTLPEGYKYVGLLYHSMLAKKPAASIVIGGIINEEVLPFAIADIKADFMAACPRIAFSKDEPVDVNANA